jgi:hypothetical protein
MLYVVSGCRSRDFPSFTAMTSIHKDSASANSRQTGTETTTVAMFSKEFQEWGRAIHKSGDAQTWSNPPPMAANDDGSLPSPLHLKRNEWC